MRLIDADAFVKEMEDRYNSAISWGKRAVASHDDEMRIRAEQASFSFVEASMTAKKMPTIDSVVKDSLTTKHGKWIEQEVITDNKAGIEEWQSAKCSKCGKYHTTPYLYYFSHYDYCPSCGAKMEEEN